MNPTIIALLMAIFSGNSLFSMWSNERRYSFDHWQTPSDPDDYHQLSEYLYDHFDKTSQKRSFCWLGMYIKNGDLQSHEWITNQAFEQGNIVCFYFFIRNYLKHCTFYCGKFKNISIFSISTTGEIVPIDTPEMKQLTVYLPLCLKAILLCLQRVTYDIMHYYIFIKPDPSVLLTYTIFKKKLHQLLIKTIPDAKETLDLYAYLFFQTIHQSSLNNWEDAQWITRQYSCIWVSSFGWKNPWTPGAWGIRFGPLTIPLSKNSYTHTQSEILKIVFSTFAAATSWQDFFKTFDFPLSGDELDTVKNRCLGQNDAGVEDGFVLI